jgi:hypothetical protein
LNVPLVCYDGVSNWITINQKRASCCRTTHTLGLKLSSNGHVTSTALLKALLQCKLVVDARTPCPCCLYPHTAAGSGGGKEPLVLVVLLLLVPPLTGCKEVNVIATSYRSARSYQNHTCVRSHSPRCAARSMLCVDVANGW